MAWLSLNTVHFAVFVLLLISYKGPITTKMIDLSLRQNNLIRYKVKVHMIHMSPQAVREFAKALFDFDGIRDSTELAYNNIFNFYQIGLDEQMEFDAITEKVLEKAMEKGEKTFDAAKGLFKDTNFESMFKKKLMKLRNGGSEEESNVEINQDKNEDKNERNVINFWEQPQIQNVPNNESATQVSNSHGFTSMNEKCPKRKTPPKIPSKVTARGKSSKRTESTVNQSSSRRYSPLPTTNVFQNVAKRECVTNLLDHVKCFCGKQTSLICSLFSFLCFYCNKRYHQTCMKRASSNNMCSLCHLERLTLQSQTKKVLFVGLLGKKKDQHVVSFLLNEEDLSKQFNIQMRCFRIGQDCQTSIQFPKSINIKLNGLHIKSFKPLHPNSSFKNRKDKALHLLRKNLSVRINNIVIENISGTSEASTDLEQHLIGIYLVEQKKTLSLLQQARNNGETAFRESDKMIDDIFTGVATGVSTGVPPGVSTGEKFTCKVVKVPLVCPLTSLRMTMPARGVFCTHYQCFDLPNFISSTTSSKTPKWLCPVCEKPITEFRIDSILFSLLQLYSKMEIISVKFLLGGAFKLYLKDSKEYKSTITSIYDLPIHDKQKRVQPQWSQRNHEEDVPKRKVRTKRQAD